MDYKIEPVTLTAPISRTGEKPHRQEFLICRTGKDSSGKTFTEYLKEFSNDSNKSPLELIDEISKNPGDYSWTSDSESAFLIEYDDETKANIKAINDYANKLKAKKAYDDLVANKYSHPNKGVDMRINSSKDYYESLNSKDASFARQMLKEDGFQPLKNEDFKDGVYETYVKPDPPDDYYFNYANHDFGWYDEVILYIDDNKISNVGQIYGSKLWNVEKYGIDFSNMKINSSNYVVALSPEGGNKSVIYGPSSQDDAKAFYDNYKASHNDDDVSVMTEESWQKVNSSKAVKSDVDGTMRQIKQVVDDKLGLNTQLDGDKAFIHTPNNLIEIDYSKDDNSVYFAVMDNSDNYVQDGFSLEKTGINELPKRIQKLMDELHDKTYVKSSVDLGTVVKEVKKYCDDNNIDIWGTNDVEDVVKDIAGDKKVLTDEEAESIKTEAINNFKSGVLTSSFAVAVSGTHGKGYIGTGDKLVENIKDAVKYSTQKEADDKCVELQKKTINTDYWTEDTSTMEKTRIQGSRAIKSDLAQDIFDNFNGLSYQDAINKMESLGFTMTEYDNSSGGRTYNEVYTKGTPEDAEKINLIFNVKDGKPTIVDDAVLLGEHEPLSQREAYLLTYGPDGPAGVESSAIKSSARLENMIKKINDGLTDYGKVEISNNEDDVIEATYYSYEDLPPYTISIYSGNYDGTLGGSLYGEDDVNLYDYNSASQGAPMGVIPDGATDNEIADKFVRDIKTLEKNYAGDSIDSSRKAIKSDLAQDIFDSFNGLSYQDAVNKMKIEGYTLVGYGNYNFSEGTVYETYAKGTPTDAEEIELIFNTKNGNATTVDDAILLGEHEDLPAEAVYLLAQGQDYLDSSAIKGKTNMTKTDNFVTSMLAKGMVDNVEMLANGYDIEKGNNKVSIRCNGSNAIIWNHKDSSILEIQSGRLDDILHRYIVRSCVGLQSAENKYGSFTNRAFIPTEVVSDRMVLSDATGKKWICSDSSPKATLEFYDSASLMGADDCMLLLPNLEEFKPGFKVSLNNSRDAGIEARMLFSCVNPEDYAVYPSADAIEPVGKTIVGNFVCSALDKATVMSFEENEKFIGSSTFPTAKAYIGSSLRTNDRNVKALQSAVASNHNEKGLTKYIENAHSFMTSKALATELECEAPMIAQSLNTKVDFDYSKTYNTLRSRADSVKFTLSSSNKMLVNVEKNGVFSSRFTAIPNVESLKNVLSREGYLMSDVQTGLGFDAGNEVNASIMSCLTNLTPVVEKDRYFNAGLAKIYGKDVSQHLAAYGIKGDNLFSSMTVLTMA